jgi:hypothetical protein
MKATSAHGPTVGTPPPPAVEHDLTGTYPRRRSDVRARAVEGDVVVLDRQRQLVHQLNQTATYIWDRCDGRRSVAAITRELAQAFDVGLEAVEKDVIDALRRLEAAGLVDVHSARAQTHDSTRRMA